MSLLAALVVNLAALVGLALVAQLGPRAGTPSRLATRLVQGATLTLFGIAAMVVPLTIRNDFTVDVAPVLLALGGLSFGSLAVLVPMVGMTVVEAARFGLEAWPGVAGLAAATGIGLAWRYWRRGGLDRLAAQELFGFAFTAMFAWGVMALPWQWRGDGLAGWTVAAPVVGVLGVLATLTALALKRTLANHQRTREVQGELHALLEENRRLQVEASKLDLLLEHSPVALAMFDRERRFVAVSRSLREDARMGEAEIVGRHHDEFFDDVPESFREAQDRALQGEVVRADEVHFVRADGRELWLRWEKRPWYEHDGSIGGFVLFTENVSAAVLAKREWVKLSMAIEQSPDSMIITNLDADIEYVNPAFTKLSGYAKEEVIGRNPRFLQSGKTPKATYLEMWAALTAGKTWRGEFINRRKDGGEYTEMAYVAPVRVDNGEVTHYIKVGEDVTERKRIAEELDRYRDHLETLVEERTRELEVARERAEVANKAKSAFLANMSHEIRTPLNAVVGLTHLLTMDDPTPRQRERLEKIDGSAGHLLSIISDILDVAKIESGKMALDERDFHLSAVLDHVRSMIAASAEAKNLTVETDRDHVPLWLRGDPARLRQALLNLAGNAVKFTQEGYVRLRSDLIEEDDDGLVVRFEVQDSGIGIDSGQLPRLFDDFEQALSPIASENHGTGLGLSITRRLAEMMGGEFDVVSKPGVGTTAYFTARLQRGHGPMAARRDLPTDAQREDWRRMAGSRILLAEDHPINRDVAMELLHGFGLDVDVAEDGRSAVEQASEHAYDLILMDVYMPEMNGITATREIRMLPGYREVPILAMTANAFEEDRRACFEAGMNDFIAKPVDPRALQATLANWLRESPERSAVRPVAVARPVEEQASVTVPWAFDGWDVAAGLRAVGGRMDRYLALLRRFALAHADDADRLRTQLSAGDRDAAIHRAHALKGVASTLGATQLSASAGRLEHALRTSEAVEPGLVDEVASDLARLLDHLDQAPTDAPTGPAPSTRSPAKVLARLEKLVRADDPQALEWLQRHVGVLREAYGPEVDRLEALVDNFDFAPAATLVNALLARDASER